MSSKYLEVHKVEKVRSLTNGTFVVQIERKGLEFKPGQHLVIGKKGGTDYRQYSIYNGINTPYFEILVKEVENGMVSPKLKRLKVGDKLDINGPMGYFTISEEKQKNNPLVFIATGTGIAPFKSFVESHKGIKYKLIHGIRTIDEAYEKDSYDKDSYLACTTRDNKGDFNGRVTDYIKTQDFDKETMFYLCGNSEMIFEAMEILENKNINPNNMFAEVYF